jgi:WD40 repeat protein
MNKSIISEIEADISANINFDQSLDEVNIIEKKVSDKNLNRITKKEPFTYDNYKISPKNILLDICYENKLYFFVGRNLDNSIKIYGIENNKNNEGNLLYNILTDSFVSCLHKKDNNIFFSGHKSGKLYEWKITYIEDKNKKNINSIKRIEIIRDLLAHKESMICCINYIEKHNIILTSSNDGKIFIRKYYDFELLSVFQPNYKNAIISRIIYTDYDLLYLLINHRDKESQNKSRINIYSLNGLLLESSKIDSIIDIEPLKNGKIICNSINSTKLKIFGFNEKFGEFNEYNILYEIKKNLNKRIVNFIFEPEEKIFYILLEDKVLYRQNIPDFERISYKVDKLNFDEDNKFIRRKIINDRI